MTYCLGIRLDAGLVLIADTRTHAGVDNVARYRKLFGWERPGTAAVGLCTAGNLSITQGVLNLVEAGIASGGETAPSILDAPSMFAVAEIVGEALRHESAKHNAALSTAGVAASASILVGGEVGDGPPRLFLVYEAGNFIEAEADTPFFQIGELKYGKPILDRVVSATTPIATALKVGFLSMESTTRSNLSVGLPLDVAVIHRGERRFALRRRVEESDPSWTRISEAWSRGIIDLIDRMPEVD
jgi:putative proteasome-type protease